MQVTFENIKAGAEIAGIALTAGTAIGGVIAGYMELRMSKAMSGLRVDIQTWINGSFMRAKEVEAEQEKLISLMDVKVGMLETRIVDRLSAVESRCSAIHAD
jgi:hypothetical protein